MTVPTRKQAAPLAKQFDVAVDAIVRWTHDPVAFVREVLGAEPDEWQADALKAFADPKAKRHALRACKGPGKTTELSWMGLNFLATRPHCKVPCASITGDNLRDGLWAEFAKWLKPSPILQRAFVWTKTRIFQRENPETWFASARTFAQDADPTQQANTLAGLHEDRLLWLLDEVSEMPDGVVSAAEAALVGGKETKIAIAGNCTRTSGPLYRACVTDREHWKVTRITGDPDDPKRSPRIDVEECRQQIARYGRESYVVKVNILGEFPDRQADKLLDRSDVDDAMKRTVGESALEHAAKIIGVDVAHMGDDASTLVPRQGQVTFPVTERRQMRTMDLAQEIIRSATKWDADAVFVDVSGGLGVGPVERCQDLGFGHLVHGVNFGAGASDPGRFENKRAEMHWLAAEWVKGGGCLPNDPLLAEELCAPIFWQDKRQRICLEAKDDIKKIIGRSPDRADGFVLTFAAPVMARAATTIADTFQRQQRREEYVPFERR